MPNVEHDLLIKVVVVGDAGVGKSNLIARYVRDFFNPDPAPTVGVDFAIKQLNIDNQKIKLQLWDTAGQERFRGVIGAYFRGAHAVLMIYDITNSQSFTNLSYWMDKVKSHSRHPATILLTGNKLDLDGLRQVEIQDANRFANENELLMMECSAKDNTNVNHVFHTLVKETLSQLNMEDDFKNNNVTVVEQGDSKPGARDFCQKNTFNCC